MARHDDDRDTRHDESRTGMPTAVLVLGLLVLVLFGLATVGGVVYLLRGRAATREAELLRAEAEQARAVAADAEARARAAEAAAKPAPIDREEFKLKVMGKTPAEVIEAVGQPDRTQGGGPDPTWVYERRTVDPVSRAVDPGAQITFKSGVVAAVSFG